MILKDEITVILTVWKRNNLSQQISQLVNQTKKPYQIWIYQNESHLDLSIPEQVKRQFNISVIQSRDINFKFHGRFVLPSKRNNCIVGANGRTMKSGFQDSDEQHMLALGDGKPIEKETQVDFVGHCWFLKSEWCKNLWKDRPFSWDNGEDIHLAASCQIYENIKCFVPRMPSEDRALWGDLQPHLGADEYASWKRGTHAKLRSDIVRHWCDKGWKPMVTKEE